MINALLIILLCIWSLIDLTTIYRLFKKKQLLFDDRFTKTMCMAIAMISSFAFALYLELLLPPNQTLFHLLPILVGLVIGYRFGAIIKAPATLNGMYNGTWGGIMGMMFGAVLQNPALCNIPIESEALITTNIYSLTAFIACLHAVICHFIRYSFRA